MSEDPALLLPDFRELYETQDSTARGGYQLLPPPLLLMEPNIPGPPGGGSDLAAVASAEAVFSMWANPRNLNVPGLVKRRLADDQWFVYKAFTSPEHRGRNLYEAGLQFVLDAMGEEGLGELVGYAHVKKRVSRKGLARLDFGGAGRLVSLHAPGLQRTFVSRRLAGRFPEPVSRSRILADLDNAPQGT